MRKFSAVAGFGRVPWKSLESGNPTAFLVAGGVLLGYAGLKGGEMLTGVVTPDVLKVTIGHLGLLVPVLGLLGLYPQLRDAEPRLSLAGVVMSGVSAVCSIVLLGKLVHLTVTMEGYPAVPGDRPLWGAIVLIASLLAIMLGFFLVGIASLRTDAISTPISYLLLAPVGLWIALFLLTAVGFDGTLVGVLVYVPIGVSLLVIGHSRRSGPVLTGREQRSTDPTVDEPGMRA